MLLVKTLKGRDALLSKDSPLTQRQRQILILVDGKRKSRDLLALMGKGATEDIVLLMRERLIVKYEPETFFQEEEDTAPGELWEMSEFYQESVLPEEQVEEDSFPPAQAQRSFGSHTPPRR